MTFDPFAFSPPAGGWEGLPPQDFHADLSLVNELRELCTRGVSDPGGDPGCERRLPLSAVSDGDLRFAVRRMERSFPGWRLTGDPSEPIVDRIGRHFEIPAARARGGLAA